MSNKAQSGSSGAVERLRQGVTGRMSLFCQFGVDTEALRSLLVRRLLLTKLVYSWVCWRPSLDKGIDTLFRAVENLKPNIKLLIVTSSPSISSEIVSLAKESGIQDRVEFKTSIPHLQLPKYFNLMNVFVLPSRRQKLGKSSLVGL